MRFFKGTDGWSVEDCDQHVPADIEDTRYDSREQLERALYEWIDKQERKATKAFREMRLEVREACEWNRDFLEGRAIDE